MRSWRGAGGGRGSEKDVEGRIRLRQERTKGRDGGGKDGSMADLVIRESLMSRADFSQEEGRRRVRRKRRVRRSGK